MITIPLTRGLSAVVDDVDEQLVIPFSWYAHLAGRTAYARRWFRNPDPDGRSGCRSMHSLLTGWDYVDHINGDGLDNRRSNLRRATLQQNQQNHPSRGGTSRFKGVHWSAKGKCWRAQIRIGGRARDLGGFDSELDAALTYDAAARKVYGEYGRYNIPLVGERSALTGSTLEAHRMGGA